MEQIEEPEDQLEQLSLKECADATQPTTPILLLPDMGALIQIAPIEFYTDDNPIDIPYPMDAMYKQWWGFEVPNSEWVMQYAANHRFKTEGRSYGTLLDSILISLMKETGVRNLRIEVAYPPLEENPSNDDITFVVTFLGTNPKDFLKRPTREQYGKLKAKLPEFQWRWWLQCDWDNIQYFYY